MSEKMIPIKCCNECKYQDEESGHYCEKVKVKIWIPLLTSGFHPDCPLENAPRWRKYPEETPENGKFYLVHTALDGLQIVTYSKESWDMHAVMVFMDLSEVQDA